jgi:uncharacterized protein (TIGR01777 family)
MYTILITGGKGFIGTTLQNALRKRGYRIVILTRFPKEENEFYWNIKKQYIDVKALEGVTHIIHLAGAGIADKRWTTKRKKEIINSRVDTATLLWKYVKEHQIKLKGFISASAIGYYGAVTTSNIYTEKDISNNDFIAKVCELWEKASQQFSKLDIPVTILRTGIVLSKTGGAMTKINTPLFLTILGNGKQYMPWIHIDDLCAIYVKAVEDLSFSGVFNTVAPEHQTNTSFTKIMSKKIGKPIFPIKSPSFILKIILGELSIILLKGSRISAKKIQKSYSFLYPTLKACLHTFNVKK